MVVDANIRRVALGAVGWLLPWTTIAVGTLACVVSGGPGGADGDGNAETSGDVEDDDEAGSGGGEATGSDASDEGDDATPNHTSTGGTSTTGLGTSTGFGSTSGGTGTSTGLDGGTTGSGGETSGVDVDCSAIAGQWELCSAEPGRCTVVFTDGAGCDAVCAAAGLACAEVWENVDDACAPDTARPALACGNTGHSSDYCVCVPGDGVVDPTSDGESTSSSTGDDTAGDDADPTTGGDCHATTLEVVPLSQTLVVRRGEVFDGCGLRHISNGLGDGGQAEGQSPLFRVEAGGTLRNVTLGAPAADGVHVYPEGDGEGSVLLENIVWEDIGEDAMTIRGEGTVRLRRGSARDGSDKVFQINAASTFYLSDFSATNAGKLIRQNGGTTFHVEVYIEDCEVRDMDESLFRTDSPTSTVSVTNTTYCDLGSGLFIFGSTVIREGGSHPQATYSNLRNCN